MSLYNIEFEVYTIASLSNGDTVAISQVDFSAVELKAIHEAMAVYRNYGETESTLANAILTKLECLV
jgi:hypothetical protein